MAAPQTEHRRVQDRRRLAISFGLALALHAVALGWLATSRLDPAPQAAASPSQAPLRMTVVAGREAGSAAQSEAARSPAPGRVAAPEARPAPGLPRENQPIASSAPVNSATLYPHRQPAPPEPAQAQGGSVAPAAIGMPRVETPGLAAGGSELPNPEPARGEPGQQTRPGAAAAQVAALAPPRGTAQPVQLTDLCPGIVKAEPPARAVKAGLGGMVLARATIRSGRVVRVDILRSEPGGLFDAAVRTAMLQYRCHDQGDAELVAEQQFRFVE